MSRRFANEQPAHGETVLHCGHLNIKPHHFMALRDGQGAAGRIVFTRPDGTTGSASWVAICDKCFAVHGTDFSTLIRGDGVWHGDEAAITVEDRPN